MAQRMKKRVSSSTPKIDHSTPSAPKTAVEMRNWYEQNKNKIEAFEAAEQAATSLRDVTKTKTKAVSSFSKQNLANYLKNISSNEKNLRNLSRYLFFRCHSYFRLIMYNATMFDLNCRTVVPTYDMTSPPDVTSFLKDYQDTLNVLDVLNLQYEMVKAFINCFKEDVFYGVTYYDETGFFILPMDPDYCKIAGVYSSGDFSYAMDMTYFRSRQFELEAWGEPFTTMYKEYESTKEKYQLMPDEYCICLKARPEDWETIVPYFAGLLNSIINLIDLEDIQAIADEQDIYKMIWMEMETMTNSDFPNAWKVNPALSIEYFNRMINDALPDYISAAIVPGKLNQINFDTDATTDTSKLAKATSTLFNSSGGAQILNSATISGTTAFTAAIQADTELAISTLLPQVQSWVNRFLSYHLSNPAKVTFFEVSTYTKAGLKKDLLESCQYGFSNILAYNTLNGISEKQTIALNFLENNCLNLVNKFVPLQSSYTQTGNEGSNKKDDADLTDEGEASREKTDNAR